MRHKTLLAAALSLLTAAATARDYGQAATVRIWDNRTAPHSNGITTPKRNPKETVSPIRLRPNSTSSRPTPQQPPDRPS